MSKLKKLSYPYLLWMTMLVLLPTILIILLSITDLYIFDIGPFSFHVESFKELQNKVILNAIFNSVKYSVIATLLSFLIGYPTAFYLAKSESKYKLFLLALLVVPLWSNMLLRIKAWENVFYPNSIINLFGLSFDLIGTDIAIIIGMVSMYLPFMILPIYSVLEKIEDNLIDASHDLGANNFTTFTKVIFPLSLSGVVSGVIMTLLPAMTAFALPKSLSGGKIQLIGNLLEDYFKITGRYSLGSLISVLLMVVIILLFLLVLKFDKEGENLV
jgi:spermidine/putrescine transport system permease protein